MLRVQEASAQVLRPGVSLRPKCAAPLGGVDFQLRRGEQELLVPMSSAYPDRVSFHLDALAPGDGGLYTCRYRLRDAQRAWSWSGDSAPVELLLSDGEPCAGDEGREGGPQGGLEVQALGRSPVPTHPPGLSFSNREGDNEQQPQGPTRNNWVNRQVWYKPCRRLQPGVPSSPRVRAEGGLSWGCRPRRGRGRRVDPRRGPSERTPQDR